MTPRKIRGPAERMLGYARVKEARDPGVTAERLREFAGDDIVPVRLYTAQSLAAPSDVLLLLARDEEACVRSSVLLNPAADEPVLRAMAEAERAASPRRFWRRPDFSVRRLVVHHPGATPALRAELLAEGACGCPRKCDARETWEFRMARWGKAGRP
ncbi:hypothetical protein OG730_36570 [Streptomyces sp. NBC_01298]|uniref:hypothetical protein n=1 Tax=Streptomyces sp. NBC_01298 TaxID=2903817 RepID=UPI002E1231FE|nr:hypothetical protein OG730_36570 [Streptomyces sp. NBC_01298]